MSDGEGRFELAGSVAGPDGRGRSSEPFVSTSGQVRIDPALWRMHQHDERTGDVALHLNRTGDAFTFDVFRTAEPSVNFGGGGGDAGGGGEQFAVPLVRNLPNGRHALEIVTDDDRPVEVEGFYVFQPPLK